MYNFVTVPEYVVACKKILAEPADEFSARQWANLLPPSGWQQFPQAVRLDEKCESRFRDILYDMNQTEERIRQIEWELYGDEE